METALPLACFLSMIRPPGIQFEDALLQIAPVDKVKCPFVKNNNDIGFYLYTRHNPTVPYELAIDDDERLFASHLEWRDPTVIYFHAFMEQPNDGSALAVRQAYMQRGDANVIMVDAQRLEAGPWYFTAAENTWYIGRFAAQFIDYLVSRGLDLSRTHLVGHSLGGQCAGVAGASLKSGRVSRITALDPALPLFSKLPLEQRLDPSDAEFVDVIHTDAGIFGFDTPVGHVDFYPNGGISPQPGCELEVVTHQKLLLNKFFCSHWRSYMFYAESLLNPAAFPAVPCESWHRFIEGYCSSVPTTHMGVAVNRTTIQNISGNTTKPLGYFEFHLTRTKVPENLWTTFEEHLWNIFNFISNWITGFEAESKKTDNLNRNNDIHKLHNETKAQDVSVHTNNIEEITGKNNKENKTIDEDREDDTNKGSKKEKKEYRKVRAKYVEVKSGDRIKDDQSFKVSDEENVKINAKLDFRTDEPKEIILATQPVVVKADNNDDIRQISLWDILLTNLDQIVTKELSNLQDDETKTLAETNDFGEALTLTTPKTIEVTGVKNYDKETTKLTLADLLSQAPEKKSHVVKRQKRFLPFLRRSETVENENFLFRMLEFLLKHRRSVVPVFTVMREINTLVKSANGELNHSTKERNNYIGAPPTLQPITYSLELGNENRAVVFVKKLLGLSPKGDKLVINGGK